MFSVPVYQLLPFICKKKVLPLTQENAADFHNVVRCFVYNKTKINFSHSSKHTGHYRTQLCYLARTKRDSISAKCISNWNTWDLVTNKGDSAFCSSNHCQCQLLIPKSTPVMFLEYNVVRNISEMGTSMGFERSCGGWFEYYVTICLKRLENHKKFSVG